FLHPSQNFRHDDFAINVLHSDLIGRFTGWKDFVLNELIVLSENTFHVLLAQTEVLPVLNVQKFSEVEFNVAKISFVLGHKLPHVMEMNTSNRIAQFRNFTERKANF